MLENIDNLPVTICGYPQEVERNHRKRQKSLDVTANTWPWIYDSGLRREVVRSVLMTTGLFRGFIPPKHHEGTLTAIKHTAPKKRGSHDRKTATAFFLPYLLYLTFPRCLSIRNCREDCFLVVHPRFWGLTTSLIHGCEVLPRTFWYYQRLWG